MYVVVFKTLGGLSKGAITWTAFESKEYFDNWYSDELRSWYEVVEKGVTEKRALELCSSPEAELAGLTYGLRQIGEALRNI